MATYLLKWSEETFWNGTLRKLIIVWEEYGNYRKALNGESEENEEQVVERASIEDVGFL